MPGIKKIRFNRGRSDGMFVFVTAFALIGSFVLLGSYANRNPKAGSTPGTYLLSDFATKEPQTYSFSMTGGLLYCFPGLNITDGQVALLYPPTGDEMPVYLQQNTNQQACFTAPQTYSKVTVKLPAAPNGGRLVVH